MLQDDINATKAKLKELEAQQAQCKHEYGEAYRDVVVTSEPHYETEYRGSDVMPALRGFKRIETPAWSRACKKCGHVQTTIKTEPVVTGSRPVF